MKLVSVTVLLIAAVVIPIATRSAQFFESTFRTTQDDANGELANIKASDVDEMMLGFMEKIRSVTNLSLEDFSSEAQRKTAIDQLFGRDLDMVGLDIYELKDGQPVLYKRLVNESYFRQFGVDASYLDQVRLQKGPAPNAVFSNKSKIFIKNSTLSSKSVPLFSIGVPFIEQDESVHHIAIGDFRLSRLQNAFAVSGARTLFLVDEDGVVLAHKDDQYALGASQFQTLPIVEEALRFGNPSSKGQKRFFDDQRGEWLFGAYSKTSFGLVVIAEISENVILEPTKAVRIEILTVAGYVLSGALFLVIVFSISLTWPIERLHEATEHVAGGNFNIEAKVRTSDEVGALAVAFNKMVAGLRERDKVKNLLTKFHGSTITNDLLNRDIALGGTRKDVTVFFSDIRDFTKFSEGHSPEEVVEMLNEYFQVMVAIITKHKGVVDKFVGDSIMAVWGAPNSSGDDRNDAVRASIEMRIALSELNDTRTSRGQSAIKIGMGVHAGTAISGTIGSTERMEYTVIGDTVNMAARIEASTKAFGTDLLLSEAVAHSVSERFALELAGSAQVKGKSEPLRMYRVIGCIENGSVIEIKTPYSEYPPEQTEKVEIAS